MRYAPMSLWRWSTMGGARWAAGRVVVLNAKLRASRAFLFDGLGNVRIHRDAPQGTSVLVQSPIKKETENWKLHSSTTCYSTLIKLDAGVTAPPPSSVSGRHRKAPWDGETRAVRRMRADRRFPIGRRRPPCASGCEAFGGTTRPRLCDGVKANMGETTPKPIVSHCAGPAPHLSVSTPTARLL